MRSKILDGIRSIGPFRRHSSSISLACGCFSFNPSKISGERSSKPEELSLSRNLIAAESFPCITNLAKTLEISSTERGFLEVMNRSCINLTSFINRFKSPCFQRTNLRCIAVLCSLLFEVAEGFWRIKDGSTIKAFNAIEFRSELELNCLSQKVSSAIKFFPALPEGKLKSLPLPLKLFAQYPDHSSRLAFAFFAPFCDYTWHEFPRFLSTSGMIGFTTVVFLLTSASSCFIWINLLML